MIQNRHMILILILCATTVFPNEQRAKKLLQCFKKTGLSQVDGFLFRQTIEREGRDSQSFLIECYLANKGEKVIAKFEEPPKMSGTKILLKDHGKLLWTYFPSTNRVRKIAVRNSTDNIGSLGFSYGDLFPYLNDSSHKAQVIGSEVINKRSYEIVEIVHEADTVTAFSIYKTQLFIHEEDGLALKSVHKTKENRIIKVVHFESYKEVDDITVPQKIVIEQNDIGEKNTLEILAFEAEKEFTPSFFSELSLKR